MGWLIGIVTVAVIGLIPIGLRGIYDSSGGRVWVRIGMFQYLLYSKQPKKKGKRKQTKPRKSKKSTTSKDNMSGGNPTEFSPIVKLILEVLKDLWKKLRVDLLELKVVLAQDDPADLAINYGRAWTAIGNLIPQLERSCNIKKRNVEVQCDFTAQQVQIFAQLHVSITLGRAIALLVRYWLRTFKNTQTTNNKKGGAEA